MTALRAALLILILAGPALSQEDAIHQPCAEADSFVAAVEALRAAGWREDAGVAPVAVAQVSLAIALLPGLFDTPESVADYTASGLARFADPVDPLSPLLVRDGVQAIVRDISGIGIQCIFAGPDLPEAETILAEDGAEPFAPPGDRFGSGLTATQRVLDLPPGEPVRTGLVAIRLEATPDIVPLLAGRYGLLLDREFPPSGT